MFQTAGKPSTWFPPVRLVGLYFLGIIFLIYVIRKIINSCEKNYKIREFYDKFKNHILYVCKQIEILKSIYILFIQIYKHISKK